MGQPDPLLCVHAVHLVKDHRTKYENGNIGAVMDGDSTASSTPTQHAGGQKQIIRRTAFRAPPPTKVVAMLQFSLLHFLLNGV
jgi:hypothetical protein